MPGGGLAANARTRRARVSARPQRVLEARAHEIEDVAVALGELTLRTAEAGDDHLTTPPMDADRDAVLDAGSVEQVAVQLAVGQAAGLDGLGETQRRTPTGGMREQERMTPRVAHDCLEGAGRLGLGGDRLVADSAGGELDAVPRQHVCGDEFGESLQRPAHAARPPSGLRQAPGQTRAQHPRLGRRARASQSHVRRYTWRRPPGWPKPIASPLSARAPFLSLGVRVKCRLQQLTLSSRPGPISGRCPRAERNAAPRYPRLP